jgi:hypothetical protein
MRKPMKALFAMIAALATAATTTASAQAATRGTATAAALTAGPGTTVVEWSQTLLSIQKTPGAQPATVRRTLPRSSRF